MAVSILSAASKANIVSLWNSDSLTKTQLATKFGVSVRTIGRVISEGSPKIVAKAPTSTVAKTNGLSVADAKAKLKSKAATVAKPFATKPVKVEVKVPAAPVSPIQWLMGPNFINLIQDGKT